MDPLSASLVGAVLFVIGAGFLVLVWFLAASEVKARLVPRPVTIAFASGLGGIAYFCLEVGTRWIFNRRARGSPFLSAFGAGMLAWMFVACAAGCFLVGWFYPDDFMVEGIMSCALLATCSFLIRDKTMSNSSSE